MAEDIQQSVTELRKKVKELSIGLESLKEREVEDDMECDIFPITTMNEMTEFEAKLLSSQEWRRKMVSSS